MEAKAIQEIINTADCNAEVNFVGANGELRIMGWARKLIETVWEARQPEVDEAEQRGIRQVVEWLKEYAVHGGYMPLKDVLEDIWAHTPWQSFLKEHNID